jgi:protein ImuA
LLICNRPARFHEDVRRFPIEELRERIRRLEGAAARRRLVLPFGIQAIDRHLPGGGLALGALHEVAGGGNGAIDGAAAALFGAGIVAHHSTRGRVIWCATRQDLFAPAIAPGSYRSRAGDEKARTAPAQKYGGGLVRPRF